MTARKKLMHLVSNLPEGIEYEGKVGDTSLWMSFKGVTPDVTPIENAHAKFQEWYDTNPTYEKPYSRARGEWLYEGIFFQKDDTSFRLELSGTDSYIEEFDLGYPWGDPDSLVKLLEKAMTLATKIRDILGGFK